MLRIRKIEEKIAELYPEQEMRCPIHLCIGQEAVAVGVCQALTQGDYAMSGHRAHGHYLAKGGDLRKMMAELYGKGTGCSKGKGGSMHLIDLSVGFLGSTPIVGSTIPIGVGAALGTQMKKESRVTTVFFGEAATEEGVFHESINFAVLKKLPVIFICENNLYSVYSPLEVRQPENREVFELVCGYGIESHKADGNDVVAVFTLAQKAIQKAREGKGPSFLEFTTYRWREHCGPNFDNDLGYRTPEEFEIWKKKCPLENFRKKLLNENSITEEELNQMAKLIDDEVEGSVQFAKQSPFPEESALYENVYA